ncbi:MAG: ankyrin repeat domain-containing protein [Phycisphaerales bacterium JB060]
MFVPILLLALGLCSSVLVAWAGALVDRSAWPDTLLTGVPEGTRTEMRGWLVEEGRDRTLTWRTFDALDLWDEPPDLEAPTTLPAWSVGHGLPDQPGPFAPARARTFDQAWEVSAGWPARCVRAVRHAGPTEFALPGEHVRGGLAAMAYAWPASHDAVAGHERIVLAPWPIDGLAAVVPLRPMPIGLAINTLVHALAWSVLLLPLVALRPLRRRRRARKNRCVACGHARDGLPDGAPCAECGRDPNARTSIAELLTARAPMLGAAWALILVLGASAALLTHRWMAVDRLPPLHRAAAVGDVEEIERLLAGGAEIDGLLGANDGVFARKWGTTALGWAAGRGHGDAVAALLDAGADRVAGSRSTTPVPAALRGGHERIALVLLDAPPRIGDEAEVIGHLLLAGDDLRARIIGSVAWSDINRSIACASAVRAADLALLDALLAPAGASPAPLGVHAMHGAVGAARRAWREPWRRDLGMTASLLARDVAFTQSVLDAAVQNALREGVTPAVAALLRAGADPGRAPMHAAIDGGDPAMVAVLAHAGVAVDATDASARTALWRSAELVRPGFVRALLDAGADPTFEVDGQTAARMLARVGAQARAGRGGRSEGPYPGDRDAIARILDLLEAAEARWRAGEGGADAAQTPGGP